MASERLQGELIGDAAVIVGRWRRFKLFVCQPSRGALVIANFSNATFVISRPPLILSNRKGGHALAEPYALCALAAAAEMATIIQSTVQSCGR